MAIISTLKHLFKKPQHTAPAAPQSAPEPQLPVETLIKMTVDHSTCGTDILNALDSVSQQLFAMNFADPQRTQSAHNTAEYLQNLRCKNIMPGHCPFADYDHLIVTAIEEFPRLCKTCTSEELDDMLHKLEAAIDAHTEPMVNTTRHVRTMEAHYYAIMLITLQGKLLQTLTSIKADQAQMNELAGNFDKTALMLAATLNERVETSRMTASRIKNDIQTCQAAMNIARQEATSTGSSEPLDITNLIDCITEQNQNRMSLEEEHAKRTNQIGHKVQEASTKYMEHKALLQEAEMENKRIAGEIIQIQKSAGLDVSVLENAQSMQPAAPAPAEISPEESQYTEEVDVNYNYVFQNQMI